KISNYFINFITIFEICYRTYKLQTVPQSFATKIVENQGEKQYELNFNYLNLNKNIELLIKF
ncbi:hypothetical protein ACFLTE_05955, partial [Bacteroidota bacterium]